MCLCFCRPPNSLCAVPSISVTAACWEIQSLTGLLCLVMTAKLWSDHTVHTMILARVESVSCSVAQGDFIQMWTENHPTNSVFTPVWVTFVKNYSDLLFHKIILKKEIFVSCFQKRTSSLATKGLGIERYIQVGQCLYWETDCWFWSFHGTLNHLKMIKCVFFFSHNIRDAKTAKQSLDRCPEQ